MQWIIVVALLLAHHKFAHKVTREILFSYRGILSVDLLQDDVSVDESEESSRRPAALENPDALSHNTASVLNFWIPRDIWDRSQAPGIARDHSMMLLGLVVSSFKAWLPRCFEKFRQFLKKTL